MDNRPNLDSGERSRLMRILDGILQFNRKRRHVELALWLSLSALLIMPIFVAALFEYPARSPEVILIALSRNFGYALLSFLCAAFPFLYYQIFGQFPLEALRERVSSGSTADQLARLRVEAFGDSAQSINVGGDIIINRPAGRAEALAPAIDAKLSIDAAQTLNPRQLLSFYAERSALLSQKIYTRAGVYLMVGVIIAFVGLFIFFYLRQLYAPPTSAASDFVNHAFSLLPGFGVLFFIEFVALFFLRQYKTAMDEFRYYELVKRNREENLVILKMFEESGTIVPTREVLQAMTIYSSPGKLSKDESTEILEAKKLSKDELVILEKFVDILAAAKSEKKK